MKQFFNLKRMVFVLMTFLMFNQTSLFAQSPSNGIFFQAVARDQFANPAKDRKIYVQSSIIQTTATGTKVLIEEHQTTTDGSGVFSISVGQGTRTGGTVANLDKVEWAKGPYYLNLKIAITPIAPIANWDHTKDWIDLGSSPFGTVPYALYSGSSGALDDKLSIADTAKMLAIYAKAQLVNNLSTQVNSKISASDTATMLAPYAKMVSALVASNITSLTAASVNAALDSKVNVADSGLVYVTPLQLKGVTFDTTSLITKINNKVSLADSTTVFVTPLQLAAKTFDSTAIYAQLGTKLNKADTSTLSNRINLKANTTDLTTGLDLKLNKADTSTLSNRINLKANTTDLTTGLDLKLNKTDTSTLSNRINLKANSTDLTSGLALKFNKADTSYLLQKADTSTLSNRINLKANSTDLTSGLALKLDASQKGAASGVASLDINSKVPASQIPVVSFQSANVVTSQAAMLGLSSAVVGSIAIRTDSSKNFVLSGADPSIRANWVELAVPTSVTTINGIPGAYVTLTTDEIGEGTSNKYYTDARVRNAISASAPLNYNASTGTFSLTAASGSTNGYLTSTDYNTFNNKQNTLTAGVDYATPSGNITGNAANVTGIVSIVNGGTGTTTSAGALINLGAEASANKSTATDLGNTNPSDLLYPSQKAVKTYVDLQSANAGVADLSITNAKLAGSITADKLLGSIPNNKLTNSTTTLGSTTLTLGGTVTSVTGLSSVSSTGFTGALTGNASTATALATGRTISLTGDVTYTSPTFDGSGDITAAATLAASGVNSGTYGSSTAIPVLTVDTKGRVTSASTVGIIAGVNSLNYTSTTSYAAGGTISGTSLTLTAADGTNPGLISTGAQTIAGAKTFNSDVTAPNFIGNVTGTVTGNLSGTATTATNLAGGVSGSIPYQTGAGTTAMIPVGSANQFLTSVAGGTYTWTSASAVTGNYVPYTGANANLNLGANDIYADNAKFTGDLYTVPPALTTAYNNNSYKDNNGLVIHSYNQTGSGSFVNFVATGKNNGNWNSNITFLTRGSVVTDNPVERLRITKDGRIGIGTTSPTTTLDVAGSANISGGLSVSGTISSATWSGTVIGSNYGGAGSVNGILIANGSGMVSAAVAGTDFQTPLTAGSGISIASGTISATDLTTANLSSTAGITNAQLANSSTTLGSTTMTLGGTVTSVTGLTSLAATNLTGTLSGTATSLATGRTIALTGDVTYTSPAFDGSGNVTAAATLANSGVASGTYGSSTAIPVLTVDTKGRVISASTVGIIAGVNSLNYTSTTSYAAGGTISGTSLTLTAADGTNPGLISTGAQTIAGAKTFSNDVTAPNFIGNVTGTVTGNLSGTATTATNIEGGVAGSIPYQTAAGTTSMIPVGSANQLLTSTGSGTYTWTSASTVTGNFVPYTGATAAVNLGAYDLTVNGLTVGTGVNGSTISNTAFGVGALAGNNSGTGKNTAIGYSALNKNTTGQGNTALGYNTSFNQTNSIGNTAIGSTALEKNIANGNTAVGNGAGVGLDNNTFQYNSFLGYGAGGKARGAYNVGVGYLALEMRNSVTNTGADRNVAIGNNAMTLSAKPISNVVIGDYAGYNMSNGSYNAILGQQSGYNLSDGYHNTFLGDSTGLGITTGSRNTIIGAKVTGLSPTLTGNIILADGAGNIRAQHDGTGWSVGTITSGVWSGTAIANDNLANSTTTLGSTTLTLGGTVTSVTGLSSVSSTGFTGALTGNASTATALATSRNINGVAFDGSADITIAANSNTLTGTTLASNVVNSSLTSVGTITSGVWSGTAIANDKLANSTTILGSTTMTLGGTVTSVTGLTSLAATNLTGALTGNASTATALATGRTISLTGDVTYTSPTFDGSGDITAAATLAASGVNSGTYGSSTAVPVLTVDTKGRVTSASTVGIIAGVNSLNYTSTTSYAAGGTISGTSLTLAAADGTNPGLISTGAQTIAGAKTFTSALTVSPVAAVGVDGATTSIASQNATSTTNSGGGLILTSGSGGSSGNAGNINLNAGSAGLYAGNISLTAGNGGANGGNISLTPGSGTTNGSVQINGQLKIAGGSPSAGKVLTASDANGLTTWTTLSAITSLGTFTTTSYAKGAVINGNTLTLSAADDINPGLLTTGVQTIAGSKTFTSTISASSGVARGINFTPKLTATANSDVLAGIDINPTFVNGSFTGVNNYGLRVQGIGIGTGKGNISTNTTVGNTALVSNSNGYDNTAFGYNSMTNNTTGDQNSSFGSNSLKNNVTGSDNTAFGFSAMLTNGAGSYNTAIGSFSQGASTGTYTNSSNTSVGFNSLNAIAGGSKNTALGASAMYTLTTGSYNVAIGEGAGATVVSGSTVKTTGDYGVYLGYRASPLADNTNNEIVIGGSAVSNAYNTGLGTNSTLIGNNYTQKTQIYGILNVIPNTAATATNGLSSTFAAQNAGVGSVNNGGDINITAGNATSTGFGGNILLTPGTSSTAANKGIVKVNGQIQITGGTPAAGEVLTSDANGLATWVMPTGITIGAISLTATSTGATIASGVLNLTPADASNGGVVTTGSQTIAGTKTFSSDLRIGSGPITVGSGKNNLQYNTAFGTLSLNNISSTLTSSATSNNNSGFGYYSLRSNTEGMRNTAMGSWALSSNETGNDNVAIGYLALGDKAPYNNNIAIGSSALRFVTGDDNIAFGKEAGSNLGVSGTAGTALKNILIGSYAGVKVGASTTMNTTGRNSVLIGYDVRPAANDETNEIVIAGYNGTAGAVGLGSNTTLIGNSATTNTRIMGALDLPSTTSSTSTATGALTVGGGAGIAGALNVGGATTLVGSTTISSTTTSSNTTTGALIVAGGAGIVGNVNIGGTLGVTGASTLAALTTTGAATFSSTVTIPTSAGLNKVLTSDANGNATWKSGYTAITTKTADYTLTLDDNFIIVGSTATTGKTFTLPTAVGSAGKEFTIKNLSAFSITIASSGGKLVQDNTTTGSTTALVGIEPSNNWIKVISDGTDWIIFRALF